MKTALKETTRVGKTTALGLAAAVLAVLLLSLAGVVDTAEAKKKKGEKGDKIAFSSDRTTGKGVDNPEGDREIFIMNPDGKELEQLTKNAVSDFDPVLYPNGQKVAYTSVGIQTSNPEGDFEVYLVNADGSGRLNLTDNDTGVGDFVPDFSPDGKKVTYQSQGAQTSNPEGDNEIYVINANGTGLLNLSNNGAGVEDFAAAYAPDGKKVAYQSQGAQTSNAEGDTEVYLVNALDGTGLLNLTDNGAGVADFGPGFSPNGKKVAFTSSGAQTSNPEGDSEVYLINADGSGRLNFTSNSGVFDFARDYAPDGKKVVYESSGAQTSNREGDIEVYVINADGSGQLNLSNNTVSDSDPDFAPDGKKVAYRSSGAQTSNPEGDNEIYTINVTGSKEKNLTNNTASESIPNWGGKAKKR